MGGEGTGRDTIGLRQVGSEGEELLVFRSGKSPLSVYRARFAGTNQATAVTWDMGDGIEDVVVERGGRILDPPSRPGMREAAARPRASV